MAFDTSSYDLLKKAKEQAALNVKNNANLVLNGQETGVNNNYTDLMATLAKRKTDAETAKTTQLGQGENAYSTQRDQAVQGVNNSMSGARDWLASHGISGSNENADQMGRMQTQLGNKLSGVNVSKNTYDTGVNNNFNGVMTEVGNSQMSADREKSLKIAEILAARTSADNTYNSDVQAGNDAIEAQKLQDYQAYNERLRQEQVQAQQAEMSRQASYSKSSSASSSKQAAADSKAELNSIYAELYSQSDNGNGEQFLTQNRQALIEKYGNSVYSDMRKTFEGYQSTANANIRKNDIYNRMSTLN